MVARATHPEDTMPVILCYGDSNTHGTPPMVTEGQSGRYPPGARWPDVMAVTLGKGWTVIAEGLPGRTTVHDDPIDGAYKNGRLVLPAVLHSHKPLDMVVIMLGTNDLKAQFAVMAGDIAAGCARLIEDVRAAGVGHAGAAPRILLVAPTPILEIGVLAETFTGGAEKSRMLAALMAAVAAQSSVAFFDAGQAAVVDPLDGVHFAAETHVDLGRAMAEAVKTAWANAA